MLGHIPNHPGLHTPVGHRLDTRRWIKVVFTWLVLQWSKWHVELPHWCRRRDVSKVYPRWNSISQPLIHLRPLITQQVYNVSEWPFGMQSTRFSKKQFWQKLYWNSDQLDLCPMMSQGDNIFFEKKKGNWLVLSTSFLVNQRLLLQFAAFFAQALKLL